MFAIFHSRSRSRNGGFTLMELIVVMAVIAILVAIGAPRFIGYTKDAAVTAMLADCKVLEGAAEICQVTTNDWPTTDLYVPSASGIVELLSGATAYRLSDDDISPHVRSLANSIDNYALITSGNDHVSAGNIVFTGDGNGSGLADRKGVVWYGIDLCGTCELQSGLRNPEPGEIEIWTATELANIGVDANYPLDGNYIQMANIDLSSYAAGEGWEPIGNINMSLDDFQDEDWLPDNGNMFTGKYDGNGYCISHITINRPNMFCQGLFGWVTNQSELSHIKIDHVSINGYGATGSLVGMNKGVVVSCCSHGNVTGVAVGGLVGTNGGSITKSYSVGYVKGSDFAGGLVGSNSGILSDSYSVSNVEGLGNAAVGGLVGDSESGTVAYCYATGNVVGNGSLVGGLMGCSFWATVLSSYWDINTSGCNTSAEGNGATTAEMMQQATYNDWDFDAVWAIDDGCSYPYLRGNEQVPHPQ